MAFRRVRRKRGRKSNKLGLTFFNDFSGRHTYKHKSTSPPGELRQKEELSFFLLVTVCVLAKMVCRVSNFMTPGVSRVFFVMLRRVEGREFKNAIEIPFSRLWEG